MNRTRSIALFAGIFAIAMTTYGLSGISASPMIMASVPQTQEAVGILGHVEYTLLDSNQQIKAYLQTDNVVVDTGKDCAGQQIFGAAQGAGTCERTTAFTYIAIGNGSQTADIADIQLDGDACATSSVVGELARKLVVPSIDQGSAGIGVGTEVVLDVGQNTFTFTNANTTTDMIVTQSAIFNGISTDQTYGTYDGARNDGSCVAYGAAGAQWEMFAIQDLSGSGVSVSSGDSLAVKWTITLN